MMIFLYDLVLSVDHGILALQWVILFLSRKTLVECSHTIVVTTVSFIARAVLLLFNDNKLRQAEKIVNKKPVEKFIFNKKRKGFQVKQW